MSRRTWVKYILGFWILLFVGCTAKTPSKSNSDTKEYWTCSMHPQVHLDVPGSCPICHMPLILVKESPATESQIKNVQLNQYTVAKKNLDLEIAVSGRLSGPREVSFQVYESDVGTVKAATSFAGYSSLRPELIIEGKISHIDDIIDPSSRTVRVGASLNSAVTPFVAESTFHGKVHTTLKDQMTIPEDSVLHAGQKNLVYVVTSRGKFEPREVTLGQKSRNDYQVLSGLKEGEVISAGANFLIDSEAKLKGQ